MPIDSTDTPPPDFAPVVAHLRKILPPFWADVRPDLDREEAASAEMTTYALALAASAREHGLSLVEAIRMLESCYADIVAMKARAS